MQLWLSLLERVRSDSMNWSARWWRENLPKVPAYRSYHSGVTQSPTVKQQTKRSFWSSVSPTFEQQVHSVEGSRVQGREHVSELQPLKTASRAFSAAAGSAVTPPQIVAAPLQDLACWFPATESCWRFRDWEQREFTTSLVNFFWSTKLLVYQHWKVNHYVDMAL